ncbi:MAG: hypothetical protein WD469_04355 [Paenibacillaceae bacterium]
MDEDEYEIQQQVIQNYQRDEQMMILIFAQWCVNNALDPLVLYRKAYPDQMNNPALQQTLNLTVTKEEAGEIDDATLLSVLSMFDNDELAYVVTQEIDQLAKLKK